MKKALLMIIVTLSIITSLTGCNKENQNSQQISENIAETEFTQSESEIPETSEYEESTVITTIEVTETGFSETIISDSVNDVSENSEYSSEIQEENPIVTNSREINGFTAYYDKNEIPDEYIDTIAEYFQSLQNKDTEAYESMLIPLYKDYLNEYLTASEYTTDTLLSKYYDSVYETTGGDFEFSHADFKRLYDNDYETYGMPNYIESYIEQLNEISQENDGTDISETFEECYGILCNVYAKSGDTEYKVINSGIVSVFVIDGECYIMMA